MGYRVYDKKKKKWVKDNMCLTPDGELLKSNPTVFGGAKLSPASQDRYAYLEDIDLCDKNGTLIFVGDYISAEVADDRVVEGVVTYAKELSSYVIVCFDCDEYYVLGESICKYIEVIGNVFDEFFDDKRNNKNGDKSD